MESNAPIAAAGDANPTVAAPTPPGAQPPPTPSTAPRPTAPKPVPMPSSAPAKSAPPLPVVKTAPKPAPVPQATNKGATGPKFLKANSAMNALKHGQCARKQVLLPHEDPEEFQEFYDALFETLAPQDLMEAMIVDGIIWDAWMARRISLTEGAAMRLIVQQNNALYGQPDDDSTANEDDPSEDPQMRQVMTLAANVVYDFSKEQSLALIRRYSGVITREMQKKLDQLLKYRETRQRLNAANAMQGVNFDDGEVTDV